ncbi:alkaline phosphatase family protein [Brevibacillus brevis]|uniref:Alkaline phosphatase family protein n=1 Tax=Brevibacillus brevis TaxID=1393 RepID=A0ABY9SYP2_BREBE|nr:alkaline phosphatase family protein [Brevibacillus brevis]WNC12960.1 alkaline phosphatase family protein [Brevibacillus brevis]
MRKKHVVVLDMISLQPKHLRDPECTPHIQKIIAEGQHAKIRPVFPAVTGTVQATYLTGKPPNEHGIICNGLPDRDYKEITMWNQTMVPIQGEKLWEKLKKQDPQATTAVLFWQFSKLSTADYVVTPGPIHLENRMIQWCDSKPRNLYQKLRKKLGDFDLRTFWGPLASIRSSEWIMQAALHIVEQFRPQLTLAYLPNLDYNAQRFGPDSEAARNSIKEIDQLIGKFVDDLKLLGLWEDTRLVLLSEYAFQSVNRPVYINQILNQHGYVAVKRIDNMDFLDFEMSKAFALADHQVAHVYVSDPADIPEVKRLLAELPGVAEVWGEEEKKQNAIDHDRSGELIVLAEPDSWFVYYWWLNHEHAPEFAHTVDIHRKPGYDPVELFVDPKTLRIPLEPDRIRGSHGLPVRGENDEVSLVVSDREMELPQTVHATEIHDLLLRLCRQEGGV